MLRSIEDSPLQATPSRIFAGVRFLLLGFSPSEEASVRSKLLSGGGVDAREYGPRCTHLIVDKIVYDDSECVIARNDGKTVVTALWVEHCLDLGMLDDTSSILYRPVKDLNGIPGAKSMSVCLTGYQRQDRDDIMKMVGLMGAYFSKPLVANKVTHLICYKFEGEKYELAKKLKKIKLVNHHWLEDCLKAWEILPESNYSKSGYELEMMEAEAKDSEEETEEDKTCKLFGGNVAAEPSNLHCGSGATIPKESEVSFSVNKDEAAKKNLSNKMQDDVNGITPVKSPRKAGGNEYISELQEVNRNQHELTGHVTQTYDKAICGKESNELLSNSITAREALPSDAITPNAISYSRKPPRRSPASKLSGMFSSKVPGIPNGVSEPSNVKDSFNVSPPKLEQLKDNTDFGTVKSPDSELKLQSEGGSKRLQKRKISASNVSSKSPKTDVNSKPYASGTPVAGVNNDGLLINRSETVSASHTIGDNRVEKNDVLSSGSNKSANVSKFMSLNVGKSSSSHGMAFSGSPVFDAFKVPSDLMMSDKTPETSGLSNFKSSPGLSNSKSTIGAKNEDKEMCSLTHLQLAVTDPGVDQQNTIISSVEAGNCENGKPASPVNLGADNRSKKEGLSRSVTKKKVVKKTLGSKSKLISGSSKQKGSLCLNEKSLSDDDMFSREKGQEAEDVKDDIAGQAIHAEPATVNEVTENKGFDNKVLNDVAVEDDETEAPEEDTGAELANAANEEMPELIPQANAVRGTKLNAEPSSAMNMKRDTVHKKNTIVISEKVEPTIVVGVTKSDEVGGLKLNEGMDKGKNDVSSKKKKNAAAVVRKTEKSGKGQVAELKEIDDVKTEVKNRTGIYVVRKTEKSGRGKVAELKEIGDAKMEVKKKTGTQRPASKLKSKSISLGETELPTNGETDNKLVEEENLMQAELKKSVDDSKGEVKKSGMHRSTNKLKNKSIALGETEVSKNGETDKNKLVEEEDLMQGRKYASSKGKMTLQRNVKKAELTAEIEMGELSNGDGGALETENAKEVQRPATKPKSKTVSAVKTQKCMEEEGKENKPVETGSVFVNSSKPKESISAKLKRALRQTDNSGRVTKADQKISARVSKVVKPEPVCFILSGHRLQRKEFQQMIRRMKGRVCRDSHNWSYEATHFVVPDPIRRTEKFFAAAASGRWILKTDYLTASNQEGKFLPEEPYEWFKKGFNEDGAINLEAPRKWRLLRERTGHGAFYGMRITVYGECIAPPLDTLKRAVKAGDGVILATAPPYTRYLNSGVDFAVVCPGMPCVDSWVQEFLRHEIPCVSADYLVEYVCKPGCSLERHVLFKTEAWADKSYANLISRSEEVLEDLTSLEDGDEDGNNNSGSDDVSCQICGSRERAEVMLICGDETGSLGCGIGTHIDCCDPPLDSVPEEDWFCPKCYEARNGAPPKKKTKKEPRSSKRK